MTDQRTERRLTTAEADIRKLIGDVAYLRGWMLSDRRADAPPRPPATPAPTGQRRRYTFDGEEFALAPAAGGWVRVSLDELAGYVGVAATQSPDRPYVATHSRDPALPDNHPDHATVEDALQALCAVLLDERCDNEALAAARQTLSDFLDGLPGESPAEARVETD